MAFQIVKIPDLPVASVIVGSDQYPVETSTGTKRVTQAVIDSYSNDKFIRKNVNDSTTGVITAAGFTVSSSRKLKENIQPIEASIIKQLLEIVPVNYNFKADSLVTPGKTDVGLIAEDVQSLLPLLVVEDTNGNLSVDYSKLSVYLLVLAKNLADRVKRLEQK